MIHVRRYRSVHVATGAFHAGQSKYPALLPLPKVLSAPVPCRWGREIGHRAALLADVFFTRPGLPGW